jgi:hypothetical protein
METKNTSTRNFRTLRLWFAKRTENEEVTMANTHSEIKDEIIAIEKQL